MQGSDASLKDGICTDLDSEDKQPQVHGHILLDSKTIPEPSFDEPHGQRTDLSGLCQILYRDV